MEQVEPLHRMVAAVEEGGPGNTECAAADRAATALVEDVGAAHEAQITNQPVEAGIAHHDAIDVDHGLDQPDRDQQGCERGAVDGGVKAGRGGASIETVGGKHRGPKSRQAVAADDRSEQQPAGTKPRAQSEGSGLDIVGRFQIADRQAQVEAERLHFGHRAKIEAGTDRGQSGMPVGIVAADGCGVEGRTDVGQPVEAIVECALVKEAIAAKARGSALAKGVGMIVEQKRFHAALVQGGAGGNKGQWRQSHRA